MEPRRRRKPLTRDQLLGIANYLTYGRIAIVPVVMILLTLIDDGDPLQIRSNLLLSVICTVLTTIAGISDVVDGYYARKFGITSSFGKFLDPLADKLLSLSVFVMLIPLGRIDAWIVVLLMARDITITALRSMAAGEGIEIAASEWGKKKTLIQSIAMGFLLLHYDIWGIINAHRIGTVLIWLTLIVSLGSGLHYVWAFFSEVLKKERG